MKRSEINEAINWAKLLLRKHKVALPPFAYWSLQDWKDKENTTKNIISTMLGWDVTDFGAGDFHSFGAVLFTARNGLMNNDNIGTPYAEKFILLREGQRLPLHHHRSKTEDIINRCGGILAIKLYNSLDNGHVDYETFVKVDIDGVEHTFEPGQVVEIELGASITLRPYIYHVFWAKEGSGDLICGEVSSVNDDQTDNYNAEEISRFTTILEDEEVIYPLCNEYKEAL